MIESASAHLSAQAIPTRRKASRYAVHWAETPDAVPPWDPTRGGNPYTKLFQLKKGKEYISMQQLRGKKPVLHNDETYQQSVWKGEDKTYQNVPLELRPTFIKTVLLQDEPYLRRLERQRADGDTNVPAILEPPDEYPRIVRSTPWATPEALELAMQPLSGNLIQDLSRLIPQDRSIPLEEIISTAEFRDGVVNFAATYGVLEPEDPGSAYAWAYHATIAAAHLDLLACIQQAEDVDEHNSLDLRFIRDGLRQRWGIEIIDGPASPERLGRWAMNEVLDHPLDAAIEDQVTSTLEFRLLTVKHLRSQFAGFIKDKMDFDPSEGVITLKVGVSSWLWWELATLWGGSNKVLTCDGCKRTFVKSGRQKWCTPNSRTCAMRSARKIATTVPQLPPDKAKSKPVGS